MFGPHRGKAQFKGQEAGTDRRKDGKSISRPGPVLASQVRIGKLKTDLKGGKQSLIYQWYQNNRRSEETWAQLFKVSLA